MSTPYPTNHPSPTKADFVRRVEPNVFECRADYYVNCVLVRVEPGQVRVLLAHKWLNIPTGSEANAKSV